MSFWFFILHLHLIGEIAAVRALRPHHPHPEHLVRVGQEAPGCLRREEDEPCEAERIDLVHEEAGVAFFASHGFRVDGVQEADVGIVGGSALRIAREDACEVLGSRGVPEDMRVPRRADLD